ncbi:hypothetical protein BDAP_002684 [Binucleata daphniae]
MNPNQVVKITAKNTWSLDLIDNFQPQTFYESDIINFNKVSSTLNTCMQIYSMRVDDIANNTNKLLHNFESYKKRKKKCSFITEDTNLKFENIDFFDPYFNLDGFLSRELNNDGFYSMYQRENNKINFYKFKSKKVINTENKIICSGLERFNNFRNIDYNKNDEENNAENNVQNNEQNNQNCGDATLLYNNQTIADQNKEQEETQNTDKNEDNYFEIGTNEDYIDYNTNLGVTTNFEVPAIVNKGWAGPNYWSMQKKKQKSKVAREKKCKQTIDFTKPINDNIIFETANNCIEPRFIKERRKTTYNLPEDYQLKSADLYKYMLDNEYFGRSHNYNAPNDETKVKIDNKIDANFVTDFEVQNNEEKVNIESCQEIVTDLNNVKNLSVAKNILNNFTKVPKKVDIAKLKEEMYDSLQDTNNLETICKNAIVNSKNDDVSIHYCLVSLLHLANEKNVKIESTGKEFVIKK